MKFLKSFGPTILLLSGVLVAIALMMSVSEAQEREKKYWKDAVWCVQMLNLMGGMSQNEDGIKIEKDGDKYRFSLTDTLEKTLPRICEEYNKVYGETEEVTPEHVKAAITDDLSTMVKEYHSDEWESYFMYKLFYWLGEPRQDDPVSVVISPSNSGS